MTLTRPHRTILHWLGQGFTRIAQLVRAAHQCVQACQQARQIAQATITVTAEPIAPPPLPSTEQEMLQVSEQVACQMAAPLLVWPELHPGPAALEPSIAPVMIAAIEAPIPSSIAPPALSRSNLVMALLDEAWGQGHTTYPALMAYVKQQTGTGCSKRIVAHWKRQRRLIDEAA